MTLQKIFKHQQARVLIPATLGLIAYANWAAYINKDTDHQLTSALVEGSRTFFFTFMGNLLTETIWSQTKRLEATPLRIPLTCLITWTLMQSLALSVHLSINPSTALATIAPSLIMSTLYVTFYVTALSKLQVDDGILP